MEIQGLNDFIKRRIVDSSMQRANAWVLIWYPDNYGVGHASMFIGDIAETSHYVSWWPKASDRKIFFGKHEANVWHTRGAFGSTTYTYDYVHEGNRPPDVIFSLNKLNEDSMVSAWRTICCDKSNPSFIMLTKNCANIVRRVIMAGLVNSPLQEHVFGFHRGAFYSCTPKRIAVICNKLRDNGLAVKINVRAKSNSSNILETILRLR